MIGTRKGAEFPCGHPNDGLLADCGWFGKRFKDADIVDPLLSYKANRKSLFAADPLKKFRASTEGVKEIASVQKEIETSKPTTRLWLAEYRGKVRGAAIIDYFHQADDDTLLGVMDSRSDKGTYFFVLRRVSN